MFNLSVTQLEWLSLKTSDPSFFQQKLLILGKPLHGNKPIKHKTHVFDLLYGFSHAMEYRLTFKSVTLDKMAVKCCSVNLLFSIAVISLRCLLCPLTMHLHLLYPVCPT